MPIRRINDDGRWVISAPAPDWGLLPFTRTLPAFQAGLWPMVVRTCVFDELVTRAVTEQGADTVVNLASGLDAQQPAVPLGSNNRISDRGPAAGSGTTAADQTKLRINAQGNKAYQCELYGISKFCGPLPRARNLSAG